MGDLVADLTDVTLVDEDTNSIPTNNTNRTIQDNVAMPVTNPGVPGVRSMGPAVSMRCF